MSIWIDLLFLHGHFATPRALEHLFTATAPEEEPSVPAPRAPATSIAPARAAAPLPEATVVARAREAMTDDALSERLAAPLVVDPSAFTRPGVFVSDPVAVGWPSAPVLHPLRIVGQVS
jgi:hypothetical protein